MVFAEAQATGVPIVGTMHGGIPEIVVDAVTGFLAPERDYRALADRLTFLAANDAGWEQIPKCGPTSHRAAFRLSTQTALLETIYSSVLGADASMRLSKVS